MIIFNFPIRYLYTHYRKNHYGKDQRVTFVCGAATHIGEWIQTWARAFSSTTLLVCLAKGARIEFSENSRASGFLPTIDQQMGGQIHLRRYCRLGEPSRAGSQADYQQGNRRRNDTPSHRRGSTECKSSKGRLGSILGQDGLKRDVPTFFIRIGARYRRIRKRPRGKPSPQLYAYKCQKLQELENQWEEGLIDLYYGDESHVCTSGYVPYGWQFKGEDYYVPCDQKFRLNCFGIIDRKSNYDGFTTTESINADKIIEYLDHLSFRIKKKTVIVLDNAKIHRAKKVICHRGLWEKRGLFIFFIPPYSPHLNLAETLWRILKGKWIKPQDYISKDNLFYAANRALANVGKILYINFKNHAA
jgi:transposase